MSANDKDVKDSGNQNDAGAEAAKKRSGPLSMQAWDDIVGQRIAQAMKDGEFDNLPGKGKPQKLDNNHFAGENQMAFDIMQNNDISPGWISRRKEIKERINTLRADIRSQVDEQRNGLSHSSSASAEAEVGARWAEIVHQWEEEIANLNEQIQNLNLEQPLSNMEILKLRLDEEMAKVGFHHRVD